MRNPDDSELASFEHAKEVIRWCFSESRKCKPDFARMLALLQRFEAVEGFEEVPDDQSNAMIALILVTLADSYRETGAFNKAAELYCRTMNYRSALGAEYYGGMVVEHQMREHYEPALKCLLASESYWNGIGLLRRIMWHLSMVWNSWKCLRRYDIFEGRRLIRQLRELIEIEES